MAALGFEPELLRQVQNLYNAQASAHLSQHNLRASEAALHASSMLDPTFATRAHYAYNAFCQYQQNAATIAVGHLVTSPDYAQILPPDTPLSPPPCSSSIYPLPALNPTVDLATIIPAEAPASRRDSDPRRESVAQEPAGFVSPSLIYTPSPPPSELEAPVDSYFPTVPRHTKTVAAATSTFPPSSKPERPVLVAASRKRSHDQILEKLEEIADPPTSLYEAFSREPRPQRACRQAVTKSRHERSESESSSASSTLSELSSVFTPSAGGSPAPLSTKPSSVSKPKRRSANPTSSRTSSYSSPSGFDSQRARSKGKTPKNDTVSRRQPRPLEFDAEAVYEQNENHEFHLVLLKEPAEIHERNLSNLTLMPSSSNSAAPLEVAVRDNTQYGKQEMDFDISLKSVYHFVDNNRREWLLSFTQTGPTVALATKRPPAHSPELKYSFVHFNPKSMVVAPGCPTGSVAWWRVQACHGSSRHRGMPGVFGDWTARYDAESGERRPARVVQHHANCKMSQSKDCPVGELARLVLHVKQDSA